MTTSIKGSGTALALSTAKVEVSGSSLGHNTSLKGSYFCFVQNETLIRGCLSRKLNPLPSKVRTST